MSARDDYPELAKGADHDEADCPYADHGYCESGAYNRRIRESRAALDEIDTLRSDLESITRSLNEIAGRVDIIIGQQL